MIYSETFQRAIKAEGKRLAARHKKEVKALRSAQSEVLWKRYNVEDIEMDYRTLQEWDPDLEDLPDASS